MFFSCLFVVAELRLAEVLPVLKLAEVPPVLMLAEVPPVRSIPLTVQSAQE